MTATVGQNFSKRYMAAAEGRLPDVYLLYSEAYANDVNAAKSLSTLLKESRHIAYRAPSPKPVGHVVLKPILIAGKLGGLFDATVFSGFRPVKPDVERYWSGFMDGATPS